MLLLRSMHECAAVCAAAQVKRPLRLVAVLGGSHWPGAGSGGHDSRQRAWQACQTAAAERQVEGQASCRSRRENKEATSRQGWPSTILACLPWARMRRCVLAAC